MPVGPVLGSRCLSWGKARACGVKLLFLGGTGLISSACAELALARSHELTLVVRGQNQKHALPAGAMVIRADLQGDAAALSALLGARQFDAVVDFLAFTPEDIDRHAALVEKHTAQFVFISSASAYLKPPVPYLVREDHSLGSEHWDYARNKIAAEERAWRHHKSGTLPITIVRPSLTYGPTQIPLCVGSWQHPWTVIRRMLRGAPVVVPGDGTSLWSLTWNGDFAVGLLGLLGNPAALGQVIHITSDEVLTWNQIYNEAFAALQITPNLVHVASEMIAEYWPHAIGSLQGDKMHSMVFDNSRVKSLVPDFRCEVLWAEGLRRALEWHRGHPQFQTIDLEFDQIMDEIVAAHEGMRGSRSLSA
jgi:nucleoside-diphosphate-sugar epimerase